MNEKLGLTSKEVIESRNKYGSNRFTKKKKHTFFSLVIESLSDPIIKILIFALIIKLIFAFSDSGIFETLGIAIAIFLAAFVSALSEWGSEKAFEKLNESNQLIKAKVYRNNKRCAIDSEDIVVGDILIIENGDRVLADAKIISGFCDVNESSLTGESIEKHKYVKDEIYMGSSISNGNVIAEVISVGDKTYYGSIASLVQEKTIDSPLKIRLRHLAKTISKIGYISAFVVFISYLLNTYLTIGFINFNDFLGKAIYALTLSVAVVVMAVPEGLPMMITLVLSSNMKRMLKKNVLVRKLVGIETAGSLNILFTDKTGTLTIGKLKVIKYIDSNFNEYTSFDKLINNDTLYQSFVYNNSSFINNNTIFGSNSTDKAILEFVNNDDKSKYKVLEILNFDSKNKYSYCKTSYNNGTYFIKGAYEVIIDKCKYYIDSNNNKSLFNSKNKYKDYIKKYTEKAYRALSFGYGSDLDNLVFIGFILIKDEIRDSSYEAIDTIKKAGINVVMVTGDAYDTAYSISKELNIIESDDDLIISSEELKGMDDIKLKKMLPKIKVVYRSLPQDKNRLVRVSQEANYIVGMTGDGVNDAPALKKADVGFAMGSAADVSKETSDIVILDNDIKSICTAILYGRTIFKNIRKFVIFQLSVNVCAVLLSVIGPFIGIINPITVVQVLWINMVMDTFAGLAFAFEPADKEYMLEKPKKKSEPILNKYMINQIIWTSLYAFLICIWFLKSNFISSIYVISDDRHLYTAFFGLFIFLQVFNAFNARTRRINILSNIHKNKIFILIILFVSIIQVILLYFGGELFRTTGLTLYEFYIMLIIAFSIIPFDILRKLIIKKTSL